MIGPVREAERNAGQRDGDDAEQDRAANFARHQDRDDQQTRGGEKYLRIGRFAEADECRGMRDDHLCVAQADEGDEQADAGGGAVFQAVGDTVDDLFADVGEGQQQEERAGEKNDTPRAVCHGTPRPMTIEYVK